MPAIDADRHLLVYKFTCEDGRRYVVYNAAMLCNPAGHVPDKWYVSPYPVPTPLGEVVSEPFETAEEAVRAACARLAVVEGVARLI